jgi:alpha-N-acetylglucosaminidase
LLHAKAINDVTPVRELISRILPQHQNDFSLEMLSGQDNKDFFELDYVDGKVILRGNNNISLCVALNYYLKYYCNVSISWYANDAPEILEKLPAVPNKIRRVAKCRTRFFLNYCTFGYTLPWWQWKDWERLIDWMALNGITMPLAITGEEAIWYKVWRKFGLSDEQIRNYFTGPAHLPWHRMSNLDRWQSPLSMSYLKNQLELQKKILARERELNMTPVLPAFAGHVPGVLKKKFPKAKISTFSRWGGFSDEYRSYFLNPSDPLFTKIQKIFLEEQNKEISTDHVYGVDPFNEVKPPNFDVNYLSNVSKTIYSSLNDNDPLATWLMMTWIFYFEKEDWTNDRIKAFLNAVPDNKIILLDYYCENTEVWKMTDAYFGYPFIWCYLGNFGGNTMLAGNLAEIREKLSKTYTNAGKNLWGIGSTLEGFDVNQVMYDYVFETPWQTDIADIDTWITQWANRRCGKADSNNQRAWKILATNIYTHPAMLGQATLTNARPSLKGNGSWTTNPHLDYNNEDLLHAWKLLMDCKAVNRNSYLYDVVNVARQVLGNYFAVVRDRFSQHYYKKDIQILIQTGKELLDIIEDMDKLVSTQSSFLLGKWLDDAKKMGVSKSDQNYYERNARTILTTWGSKGQSLNEYANRSWSGLLRGYYKKRWSMFVNDVIAATEAGKKFDEKSFYEKVTKFEWNWTKQHELYPKEPVRDALQISQDLFNKYEPRIRREEK